MLSFQKSIMRQYFKNSSKKFMMTPIKIYDNMND
jgi:hypothetical protein